MSGKKGAVVKELRPDQFWALARREENGCWEWTRHLNRIGGYGRVMIGGRLILAHRHAYQLVHGPIQDPTMRVLHSCDNPPCINPAHLWLGTQLDNVADRVAKGRNKSGPQRGTVSA